MTMRPVVAKWHKSVTVKPNGCGFDPHLRRCNIYLNLFFHFFALVHARYGVEFYYSTRNASKIRQNLGNGVS